MTNVRTSFTLKDGRELVCVYAVHVIPGCHTLSNGDPGYPDEIDLGEPSFTLDGEPVDEAELPRGLGAICTKLYECGPGEYSYSESYDDPGFEPDEPDYLFD